MINKLVIENLKYRWVRTLGSALIVGILVASLITLIGLSRGMLEESSNRAQRHWRGYYLAARHWRHLFSPNRTDQREIS